MKIQVGIRKIFSALWIGVKARGGKGLEAGLEMGIKWGKVGRVRKEVGIKVGLGNWESGKKLLQKGL